ncbi:hypothetical protein ACERCG_01865 [Mannheimia sp. E30BD]|uniref:hypothetical protein n=1 Tax=Mannheimia sp. E30BD TaxID=3278708 RepID=UPI00359D5DB4
MKLDTFFSLINTATVGTNKLTGFVVPKNQDDVIALQEWLESSSEIQLSPETFGTNDKVSFTLTPMLEGGLGYASYEQYFERKRSWWDKSDLNEIIEHQWLLCQHSDKQIIPNNLNKVIELLQILTDKNRFYVTNNTVVFFSKKPSELALKARDNKLLVQLIQGLSTTQIQAIDEICDLLGGDTNSEHFYSKKNAFSSALTDYLTEKEGRIQPDICDLLLDIVNIKIQAIAQYQLYLEDFSYSKFVKKIEENASKFTIRINESLGKSIAQVLGLPVATAVFNIMKIELHWVSVISLMVYSALCALVLYTQQKHLDYIEKEINFFESKLPKQLKNEQWLITHSAISEQIADQKRLIKFLWFIILSSFWYSSWLIGTLTAISK